MHCQKCGKKLKPGETFCSICGYYNSEDEITEESDNWDNLSTGNEIEIEIEDDDDSDKWFEDDDTVSLSEEETPKKVKKESFWEKKKREKEAKKAQQEVEKTARAEQKAIEDKIKAEQKEQEDKLKAEQREIAAKEKEEKKAQEAVLESERKEKLEREKQEREYQKALEKQQREELRKNEDSYSYSEDEDIDEKFIRAYIGEDYEKIRYKNFNLLAALLNWAYVLYRKLYITGITGLLITEIVVLKYPKLAIFYAIFIILLIGFGFNKYYLFISKMVIKNQQKKFEGSDDYSMEKILSRKGGVNAIFTLIIYAIFLVILFYGMFHFTFNKEYNTKFWDENSNNAANCISLTKTSYSYLPNVEVNGQIIESTCKITTTNDNKEYSIYMKLIDGTSEIYAYFQTKDSYLQYEGNTKNLADLESRQLNGTITEEQKQIYNELKSIQLTYNDIYEKSKDEEKLIKEKKNTKERANFVFTKEEITR